jgi:hypothetical protein
MSVDQRVGSVGDLPPGRVVGVGRYAIGNRNGNTSSPVAAVISLRIWPGTYR